MSHSCKAEESHEISARRYMEMLPPGGSIPARQGKIYSMGLFLPGRGIPWNGVIPARQRNPMELVQEFLANHPPGGFNFCQAVKFPNANCSGQGTLQEGLVLPSWNAQILCSDPSRRAYSCQAGSDPSRRVYSCQAGQSNSYASISLYTIP